MKGLKSLRSAPRHLQEKCSSPVMHRRWWSVGFLAVLPWLSGCLYHTHKVEKTTLAGPAMDASVAQLVNGVNDRYSAISSLTATVDFQATTGGGPGSSTRSINVLLRIQWGMGNFGTGSALGLIVTVMVVVVAIPLVAYLRRREV